MPNYPSGVHAFTTKSDGAGNTIHASHVNDLQTEVTAIEQGLLNGAQHDLKPDANATRSIGSSILRWLKLWVGTIDASGAISADSATLTNSTFALTISSTAPAILVNETGAGLNLKKWLIVTFGSIFQVQTRDDAGVFVNAPLQLTRGGQLSVTSNVVAAGAFVEQGRLFGVGITQSVAFSGADYGAGGGGSITISSGDVTTFNFSLVGDTMSVRYSASNIDITGTVNQITIRVPNGMTCRETYSKRIYVVDNGSVVDAIVAFTAGATTISVARLTGNFTAGTDKVNMNFDGEFKAT